MVKEMEALDKNEAWHLVELHDGRKLLVVNGCSRRN